MIADNLLECGALAKVFCTQRDWVAVCTADCLAIRMHRAFNLPLTEFLCRQEGRCSGANPRVRRTSQEDLRINHYVAALSPTASYRYQNGDLYCGDQRTNETEPALHWAAAWDGACRAQLVGGADVAECPYGL